MKYESLQTLSPEAFRRSVGIDRGLFEELVDILAQAEAAKKKRGRPSLSLENQLCLMLSYWREYRTFFHLGLSYGVHESNAYRIVNRVETRLLAAGLGELVKTKGASSSVDTVKDTDAPPAPYGVIVDASETPIERPQKTKKATTAVRSTPTP
jgi:hypothetical protein